VFIKAADLESRPTGAAVDPDHGIFQPGRRQDDPLD